MIFPFEITMFQVCRYTFTVRIESTLFFTFHILLFILYPLSYNPLQIEYIIFPALYHVWDMKLLLISILEKPKIYCDNNICRFVGHLSVTKSIMLCELPTKRQKRQDFLCKKFFKNFMFFEYFRNINYEF